jgi:5-methylcytosine-specific restriction protein A
MARITTCLECGAPTFNASRCSDHQRSYGRKVRNPAYDDYRWRRLRKRMLAEHRAQFGDWCPGYGRSGHATSDLTLDHITPMSQGGALLGPAQVLCRSCNVRKRHVDTPSR